MDIVGPREKFGIGSQVGLLGRGRGRGRGGRGRGDGGVPLLSHTGQASRQALQEMPR